MHSSNEPLPILLRYREAARELGVCERQIHNLVDQNLLEKVKLGTKTARITRTSVLKLAAQRATEHTNGRLKRKRRSPKGCAVFFVHQDQPNRPCQGRK